MNHEDEVKVNRFAMLDGFEREIRKGEGLRDRAHGKIWFFQDCWTLLGGWVAWLPSIPIFNEA